MAKVSVLVAVYNASEHLRECLDSLIGQTLTDIRIICVDDCSTDNSLAILNEYAARDERIRVVSLPENQGQARARNRGLELADSPYTCMLDSDDWFSPDALASAVAEFEADATADCVLFDVMMVYPGDDIRPYVMPAFERLSGSEAFELSLTWCVHGLYMVRTGINVKWPYDDTCRLYSDDNTTRMHYLQSRTVRRCAGRYYYRQHQESATHKITVRRFDYLRANESMLRLMKQAGVGDRLIVEYEKHRWLNLIDVCMFYHCHGHELTPSEREYGYREIKRIWSSIDRSALHDEKICKFGYRPMPSWWLFRMQEWLYFTIRGFFGKNR